LECTAPSTSRTCTPRLIATADPTPWVSGLWGNLTWEQVARVLRAFGDRHGSEAILIAQRRRARQVGAGFAGRPVRRLWDVVQDFTVGYGYRPHRAALVLLGLIAAVALSLMLPGARASMTAAIPQTVITADATVARTPLDPCGGGRVRCFDPTLYAIDTVVTSTSGNATPGIPAGRGEPP
jgi:hypothetical protein